MTRTLLVISLLTLPLAAQAAPAQTLHFERDGRRYEVSVTHDRATQLIDGSELLSGESFHLRVDGRSVTGTYGDQPVNYRLDRAIKVASAETAAR